MADSGGVHPAQSHLLSLPSADHTAGSLQANAVRCLPSFTHSFVYTWLSSRRIAATAGGLPHHTHLLICRVLMYDHGPPWGSRLTSATGTPAGRSCRVAAHWGALPNPATVEQGAHASFLPTVGPLPFQLLACRAAGLSSLWHAGHITVCGARLMLSRLLQVADSIPVPFHEVDAHCTVPTWLASDKRETGARTIRPKIHKHLPEFLTVRQCGAL